MNIKKTMLLVSVLAILIGLTGLHPAVSRASSHLNSPTEPGNRAAAQVIIPKITKATIEKKDLIVEGENFGAGANLLLNGTKTLKARNDDVTPGTNLIVKKGRNVLPVDEVVSLQVKNPEGQVSESIGFFTGLTLTYHSTQDSVPNSVQLSQVFLLNFDDPDVSWQTHDVGDVSVIELLNSKVPLIPNAQGLFVAKRPGRFFFRMLGARFNEPPFLWLVNIDVQ